ncbi:MAG: hypothetical protein HYR74_12515 [Candidatus Eisenbacteria bacterium]|nr:hypothetical protein [Candidatus Eisenbacteria bacterium]
MNRIGWSLAVVLSLALASAALAQSDVSAGGSAGAAMQTTNAAGSADANAKASMNADASATLDAIRKKGATLSAKAQAKAEAKLATSMKRCDDEAKATGDAKVAARLAASFGATADQIMAEKNETASSWGNLMVAQCLAANAKAQVTAAQLLTLHQEMGWGQIAAGLGLNVGESVKAVNAESEVAAGHAAADARMAVIHGEGARAGLGIGAGTGLQAGSARAGAGVGVGVHIKP